jgi:peptidoglycan pentaglycine glycine transferase (the first glycine)
MRFYKYNQGKIWDDFLMSAGPLQTEFLQSLTWGKIMTKKGVNELRLYGINEEKNWLVASALYNHKLIFNWHYLYCPRGPFLSEKICQRYTCDKEEMWRLVFSSWKREALKTKKVFIRFEPNSGNSEKEIKKVAQLMKLKIKQVKSVQPNKTRLLDLSLGEEELKKQMKTKTRYNIRLAKKKGLTVSFSEDKFLDFYNILQETSERDIFSLHSKDHYEKLLKHSDGKVKLISILDEGQVIAAGLFSFFGKKAVYLHGASDYKKRDKMAPYLLQWTAIKKALDLSYRYYDFHGIDEKKWPGVTRFKEGFGGFELNYPGAFDLIVFRKKYLFYHFLKKKYQCFKKLKNYVSRSK